MRLTLRMGVWVVDGVGVAVAEYVLWRVSLTAFLGGVAVLLLVSARLLDRL